MEFRLKAVSGKFVAHATRQGPFQPQRFREPQGPSKGETPWVKDPMQPIHLSLTFRVIMLKTTSPELFPSSPAQGLRYFQI